MSARVRVSNYHLPIKKLKPCIGPSKRAAPLALDALNSIIGKVDAVDHLERL